MPKVCDVAVIGLGAMGSAALYHLAARGQRVMGFERATPGHEGGSSHGESRVIRMAYFEHPSYVPLLRRAYENWRVLEHATGETILTVTGIVEAGVPGAAVVEGSLRASRQHGLPHEDLTPAEAARRFPAFAFPADWQVVYQPDGGFLRPEHAVATHIRAAAALGAEAHTHCAVASIAETARGVRLTLEDGTQVDAGAAIVSAGAWIGELAPELRPRLKLTRQALAWFAPSNPVLVAPGRMPVFFLDTGDDMVYGFPDFAGSGVKAASHRHGRILASAAEARQDGDAADSEAVRAILAHYVPAAAGPSRAVKTCIYTSTPDQDFILDFRAPGSRVVLASPCSGHGFKFASVVGEILADLAIDGATPHDIARFRLDRLAGTLSSRP
jgi:sarcosine oxidase